MLLTMIGEPKYFVSNRALHAVSMLLLMLTFFSER